MSGSHISRRQFLGAASALAAAGISGARPGVKDLSLGAPGNGLSRAHDEAAADYTLRIVASAVEIAPKRIVSAVTYNGKFPGPLLRFKEGQPLTVEVRNDTDTPEQLHWHGQMVSTDVDGAAEEGTPFVPAHGMRRIEFTPRPSGLRFYHTHNRAGADLHAGQYSGQVGPAYIEPKSEPGNFDQEIFLVLKEFEPTFSRGGDMAQDFLAPSVRVKALGDSSANQR